MISRKSFDYSGFSADEALTPDYQWCVKKIPDEVYDRFTVERRHGNGQVLNIPNNFTFISCFREHYILISSMTGYVLYDFTYQVIIDSYSIVEDEIPETPNDPLRGGRGPRGLTGPIMPDDKDPFLYEHCVVKLISPFGEVSCELKDLGCIPLFNLIKLIAVGLSHLEENPWTNFLTEDLYDHSVLILIRQFYSQR